MIDLTARSTHEASTPSFAITSPRIAPIGIPLAERFTHGRRRLELSAQLGDALDGLVEHLQRACGAIARKMLMVTHSSRARLLNDSM
jgi:hypothetical protein